MLPLGRSFKVWAYPAPADLRMGYDRLTETAKKHLHAKVDDGACFLFVNGFCTRAKVLHYDGSGWAIYHKKMDPGRKFPQLWEDDADSDDPGKPITLSWADLMKFIRQTPIEAARLRAKKPVQRAEKVAVAHPAKVRKSA